MLSSHARHAIGPDVVGKSKKSALPMSWSSHGDPVLSADGPDTMLQVDVFSNDPTPAAPSATSSISMSTSHLSHEPGPTYPASTPPPQPAQPAGSTTPTEAAGDGSQVSASTNEHQVASTGLDAAARNPQNHDATNPTKPTNPTAGPNPAVPDHGNCSPRGRRHGIQVTRQLQKAKAQVPQP